MSGVVGAVGIGVSFGPGVGVAVGLGVVVNGGSWRCGGL